MGVRQFFFKWIKPNFPEAFKKELKGPFSSLSFDLNSLIHEVAREVFAYGEDVPVARKAYVQNTSYKVLEEEFFVALVSKILTIVQNYNGVDTVVLAVDGVAPDAKIQQQKQRRFRSAKASEKPQDQEDEDEETDEPIPTKNAQFDSNSISPGTPFMVRLDEYLKKWISTKAYMYADKWVYSGYRVPGEGEHKIMDMMRDGTITGQGIHIIHGLDADLYLLASVAPLNGIYLSRPMDFRKKNQSGQWVTEIQTINVSIDDLKTGLGLKMGTPTYLEDFVVIMCLVGNDFLPAMSALKDLPRSLDRLIETYARLKIPLSENGNVIPKNLGIFLYNFEIEEIALLKSQVGIPYKYPNTTLDLAVKDGQFDFEIYRSVWYEHLFRPRGNLDYANTVIKYMKCNPFAVTEEKIDTVAQNYLTGMAWVLRYYTGGTVNVNQRYVYKYIGAPLIYDLGFYSQNQETISGYLPDKDGSYGLNILAQLISILPPKSASQIPSKMAQVMTEHSVLADLYPVDFEIEREGYNNADFGHVIFPPFEYQRVMTALLLNRYYRYLSTNKEIYHPTNTVIIEASDYEKLKRAAQVNRSLNRQYDKSTNEPQLLENGHRLYTIFLKNPWFTRIAEGKKITEIRLARGMWGRIQPEDVIYFQNQEKRICVQVIRTAKYPSLAKMIQKEGLQTILPDFTTTEQAYEYYRQNISLDDENRFGIIAFEFRGCTTPPVLAKQPLNLPVAETDEAPPQKVDLRRREPIASTSRVSPRMPPSSILPPQQYPVASTSRVSPRMPPMMQQQYPMMPPMMQQQYPMMPPMMQQQYPIASTSRGSPRMPPSSQQSYRGGRGGSRGGRTNVPQRRSEYTDLYSMTPIPYVQSRAEPVLLPLPKP